MERQIRKHQNTLVIIGTGILLFTLWTVVKTVATYNIYLSGGFTVLENAYILLVFIVALGIEVLLRVFTGIKARSAGLKKSGSISYIFTAVILILLHVSSISYYLYAVFPIFDSVLDTVVSCIIEATGIILSAELIYSGIRLRKLLSSEEGQVS